MTPQDHYWIYTSTSGQCLQHSGDPVSENQRERVLRDAESNTPLAYDRVHNEIRSFIPVHRASPEIFHGVVRVCKGDDRPFQTYSNVITSAVSDQSGWRIRYNTQVGEFLNELAKREVIGTSLPFDEQRLVQLRKAGDPVVITTASFVSAARVCRASVAVCRDADVDHGSIAVRKSVPPDHLDWNIAVLIKSDKDGVVIQQHSQEEIPDRKNKENHCDNTLLDNIKEYIFDRDLD